MNKEIKKFLIKEFNKRYINYNNYYYLYNNNLIIGKELNDIEEEFLEVFRIVKNNKELNNYFNKEINNYLEKYYSYDEQI